MSYTVRMGDYEIHSNGRVFSYSGWRGIPKMEIKQSPDAFGYMCVRLMIDGKRRRLRVHRVVAREFLGEKPFLGAQIRHLDGDKRNNCVSNLAWGNAQENADDRENHGRTSRGEKHSKRIQKGLANARLIAAAPELLDACKAALIELNSVEGWKIGATATLKNAIAKAEGKV